MDAEKLLMLTQKTFPGRFHLMQILILSCPILLSACADTITIFYGLEPLFVRIQSGQNPSVTNLEPYDTLKSSNGCYGVNASNIVEYIYEGNQWSLIAEVRLIPNVNRKFELTYAADGFLISI